MIDTDNPRIDGDIGLKPHAMPQKKHHRPAALAVKEFLVGLDPVVAKATDEQQILYQWDINDGLRIAVFIFFCS